jgi:hypothetical protein
MATISVCRQLKVNLKAKIYIYVNSTTQRCPNKTNFSTIFASVVDTPVANLPPVSTIPAANLPPVSTTPVANYHRYQITTGIKFAAGVVDTGGK